MSLPFYHLIIDPARRDGLAAMLLQEPGPRQVVTLNPDIFVRARGDAELTAIIRAAAMVIPDGEGIVWAARRRGIPVPERIPGIDLVYDLLAEANRRALKLFLLGGSTASVSRAATLIRTSYPRLRIVGFQNGYFTPERETDLREGIRRTAADLLLVGLGGGRQERWIGRNLASLNCRLVIGVGGAIDVLSGQTRRAPEWLIRHRLEWLWRCLPPSRWPVLWRLFRFVLIAVFRGK